MRLCSGCQIGPLALSVVLALILFPAAVLADHFPATALAESLLTVVSDTPSNMAADPARPDCSLLPDPGRCHGFFRRFYWNEATRRCEPFIYGGCAGGVPFRTAAQCEAACATPAQVGSAPPHKVLQARVFNDDSAYGVNDNSRDGRSGTRPVVFSATTHII
jgi:hypothetical protein